MISLKSKREIQLMRQAADVLKLVFQEVHKHIRPGIATDELDQFAEKVIRDAGAEPAFKGYRGFPKTACISVNEEVVHGIPGNRILKEGDIISFDIGARVQGYYADAARTWPVGTVTKDEMLLIKTAKDALDAGLAAYKPGCRIGDLAEAIQKLIESRGFQVVREYVGHGIGRAIHEDPQVPNYGKAGQGARIQPGMVLAIEPMVTQGNCAVEILQDGWTVVTKDRKPASHYEDDIAFSEEGFVILTRDEPDVSV
ncbi:MAG: type I methionyl aminopeptidase [Omnitrophica bacterium GWA2_52_8]|nr:MAG: type I methionyl aminopeptidase [Omnitrophica bacterium GWA2_52_8]